MAKEICGDHGNGFFIDREHRGSATYYIAMQLDRPGGYVQKRRVKEFAYARDAKAQIDMWRAEDAA